MKNTACNWRQQIISIDSTHMLTTHLMTKAQANEKNVKMIIVTAENCQSMENSSQTNSSISINISDPHLFKYRFVVVDIIHTDYDACGGEQGLWPSWCVVIGGCYVQDILQALKLGQGSGAETNQACEERRPVKLKVLRDGRSQRTHRYRSISH